MSSSEAVPVWGVLTKANELEIRRTLARLREELDLSQLIYISAGEWTAAFFTEPSDTSYQGAAKLLQESGFSPVYRFDFSRHEDLAFFWDGASWKQAEEPGSVLSKVGLWIPGWGSGPLTIDPDVAVIERRVAILEGTTLANAKVLLGDDSIGVRAGPLGAIVHDPDLEVRFKLWTQAPNRVFDVLYYPKSKKLWLKVMKGETCLGTFRPGETRTWDGTPFLADFEGATTAEGVIDKLGIRDRSSTRCRGCRPPTGDLDRFATYRQVSTPRCRQSPCMFVREVVSDAAFARASQPHTDRGSDPESSSKINR